MHVFNHARHFYGVRRVIWLQTMGFDKIGESGLVLPRTFPCLRQDRIHPRVAFGPPADGGAILDRRSIRKAIPSRGSQILLGVFGRQFAISAQPVAYGGDNIKLLQYFWSITKRSHPAQTFIIILEFYIQTLRLFLLCIIDRDRDPD